MTRKDSEKEADRPHYYSQFWLDIAAGRRVIGTPRPNEEAEVAEVEPVPPAPLRRPGRSSGPEERISPTHAATDGYAETIVHPVAEPIAAPDEFIEPEPEIIADDDLEYQEVAAADLEAPDMDLAIDEEEEEEEFLDEEEEEVEEEEEEENLEWGRGRKKGKPTRPTKPAPKKTGRRDRRGGF